MIGLCRRGAAARPCTLLALAALALAGCGGDLASPFTAVVVAYDPVQGQYELAESQLTTVTSLRHLQGTSAQVFVGGEARQDVSLIDDPTATVTALRKLLLVSPAGSVDLSWSSVNGKVYPENNFSLELLTAYANLEKARAALRQWGGPQLQAAPVYAHTDLRDARGVPPLADGEIFFAPMAAFFLPTPSATTQLPLHYNLGAVTHGVALQTYQQIVWGGLPVDPAERVASTDPGYVAGRHLAASVAQGLADFLGAAASSDPRWFDHSLQQSAVTRALDQLRCGTKDLLTAVSVPDSQVPYDPHPLGTVLAFVLWENIGSGAPSRVARAVLAALPGIATAQQGNGGKPALPSVLDQLVQNAPADLLPALCGSIDNRFAGLAVGLIPSCAGVIEVLPVELCR